MASKRSKLLNHLAKQLLKTVEEKGDDVNDIGDVGEVCSQSSKAPTLSLSENECMNDILTQHQLRVLGEEPKAELTEKWVSSQCGGATSTEQSKKNIVQLVDYSPSSLTASSRESHQHLYFPCKKLDFVDPKICDNLRQPFQFSQKDNVPRLQLTNSSCSALFKVPAQSGDKDKTAMAKNLKISADTLKNSDHMSCSTPKPGKKNIGKDVFKDLTSDQLDPNHGTSQTSLSRSAKVLSPVVSLEVQDACSSFKSASEAMSKDVMNNNVCYSAVTNSDQVPCSSENTKEKSDVPKVVMTDDSSGKLQTMSFKEIKSTPLESSSPTMRNSTHVPQSVTKQESFENNRKGRGKKSPKSMPCFNPKSSCKSGMKTNSDLTDQVSSSTPKSSRKSENKREDTGVDVTDHDGKQLGQTARPIRTTRSKPAVAVRKDSSISEDLIVSNECSGLTISDQVPPSTPKSSRISGRKTEDSDLIEQVLSSTSKSSRKSERKREDSGVDVTDHDGEQLGRTARPIRTTRSKPVSRKPSPDPFASEEEEENWGDSEDSLILESASSSSSASPTRKKRNSESASPLSSASASPTRKESILESTSPFSSAPASLTRKKRNLEVAEMEDDSDEERNLVPQKKKRKIRKNASKLSKEEKSQKQYLRNTGQAYVTYYSEKRREARQRKKPHECKKGCQNTITDEVGDTIFHEYWEQGSYNKRVSYIASRLEAKRIKTKRPRLPPGHHKAHPKSVMWKYSFHINGETKEVCKHTFLRTLDETDGFLRFVQKKKMEKLSGVTRDDKRGKKSPKHKLSTQKIEAVTQHVLKFPSYKSHYKRAEVGDTRYLPSHLDIKQMHQMYLNEQPSGSNMYVSYSTYERIFNTLGRSFRKPPTDTCEKCDAWKQKVDHAPDEETKNKIESEWNVHLKRAQSAYDYKRNCKLQAQTDDTLRVLIFDLEQVLETPLLSTGAAFYLRQLSTYNLTIYDTTTKLTHCYMWCELDGKRGANEIASCVFVHCLEQIPETVKKVILFSDSTTGQNRNSIVSAMFLTLLELHGSINTIEHVFLEAGHTRLEVDCKHSVIERNKNHINKIHQPSDWYELVRSIGASNKKFPNGRFEVVEVKNDIYNFQALLKGPLIRRTSTTSNDKFVWITTPLLRYDANKPGKVFFKKNLDDVGYGCLDFQRTGKAGAYSAEHLQQHVKRLYKPPLPVTASKKKDLMKLLHLLPPSCHDFYKSIPSCDSNKSDDDDDLGSNSE